MRKFEYAELEKEQDRYGHKWNFEGSIVRSWSDTSLIHVLGILGDQGWELVTKEYDYKWILKREHEEQSE